LDVSWPTGVQRIGHPLLLARTTAIPRVATPSDPGSVHLLQRKENRVAQSNPQSGAKAAGGDPAAAAAAAEADQEEVAYLAKRHRVSPAIVREIMRRAGTSERAAVEREIQKGKARR
jgi:hypothetical protein